MDRLKVLASRDQHDVVAMLKQPRTYDTADAARAVDHEPHDASLPRQHCAQPISARRRIRLRNRAG